MAIVVEIILGKATWLHSPLSAIMMLSGGMTIIIGFLAVSSETILARVHPANQHFLSCVETQW